MSAPWVGDAIGKRRMESFQGSTALRSTRQGHRLAQPSMTPASADCSSFSTRRGRRMTMPPLVRVFRSIRSSRKT